MRKTIVESVYMHAQETPDKYAIITPDEKVTYSELFNMVNRYATYLRGNGIKKGQSVIVRARQNISFFVVYLAVHLCGGVAVTVPQDTSYDSMRTIGQSIGVNNIIDDSGAIPEGNIQKIISEVEFLYKFSFPQIDDRADIIYDIGLTGHSKGIVLTHEALVAAAENIISGCSYKKDTVIVVPGAMSHANAIRKFIATMVNGSTIYVLNGMSDIESFFKALDPKLGSIACCLPTKELRLLLIVTGDRLGKYPFIDFVESASAPLPREEIKQLISLLPNTRLYKCYGSCEASSIAMHDYSKYPDWEDCMGKPTVNSKIFILDDEFNPISSDTKHTGIIACKGEMNMNGYVNEPELTEKVLKNGMILTNDIGYLSEDGFVFAIGKRKI